MRRRFLELSAAMFLLASCGESRGGPIEVIVAEANAPNLVVSLSANDVDERQPIVVDASASSDPQGDTLDYAISLSSDAAEIIEARPPVWTIRVPEVIGDERLNVTILASDGTHQKSVTKDVMVRNYDRAPISDTLHVGERILDTEFVALDEINEGPLFSDSPLLLVIVTVDGDDFLIIKYLEFDRAQPDGWKILGSYTTDIDYSGKDWTVFNFFGHEQINRTEFITRENIDIALASNAGDLVVYENIFSNPSIQYFSIPNDFCHIREERREGSYVKSDKVAPDSDSEIESSYDYPRFTQVSGIKLHTPRNDLVLLPKLQNSNSTLFQPPVPVEGEEETYCTSLARNEAQRTRGYPGNLDYYRSEFSELSNIPDLELVGETSSNSILVSLFSDTIHDGNHYATVIKSDRSWYYGPPDTPVQKELIKLPNGVPADLSVYLPYPLGGYPTNGLLGPFYIFAPETPYIYALKVEREGTGIELDFIEADYGVAGVSICFTCGPQFFLSSENGTATLETIEE